VLLPIQVTVKNAVNVVTGDVRVSGEVVPDSDKTSHVEVLPNFCDPTVGRVIKFKALTNGFSKEVKLTRGQSQDQEKLSHILIINNNNEFLNRMALKPMW